MKRFLAPAILAIVATLLALVLHSPLSAIEHHFTVLKYEFRGEQQADTNIVLVYIDNDAMRELGWPLRRNFHALMVKTLSDLKAKVIGIDLFFESPSIEYPEYDQLLRNVLALSQNVVLSCYFEAVGKGPVTADADVAAFFRFPQVDEIQMRGVDLRLPVGELMNAAAGIGHVNILDDLRVPLFVSSGNVPVPAFGMEIVRLYAGLERSELRYEEGTLSYKRDGKLHHITTTDGVLELHYPGKISAFTTYPFLEVLRSYDALRVGGIPSVPVKSFKDKIVLVGAISEDRTFLTPVDERFPALGLQAVFLDNALRPGFVTCISSWLVSLLCLLVGFGCAAPILLIRPVQGTVIAVLVFLVVPVCSFIVFVTSAIALPIAPFLLVGLVALGGAFGYRHRYVARQLQTMQVEKDRIAAALRDREAKVASLERELVSLEARRETEKAQDLIEEIRRYKAEIHALSSKKDDMEEAIVADDNAGTEVVEFEGIVYDASGAMRPVMEFVSKIADSDATVLILGESGTGKEMVARAIHNRSRRREHPFIAVNCGALAENLLESELFGHEKGAFTGALKEKQGRFELANRGTIFLDEIGEVSEAFQLKLLRVLQEGEFERVGGTKTLQSDVRVIAATNKDLKQRVKEKHFREDLFYRLNVLSVELPPLRDRPDDIPLLMHHFLKQEGGGLSVSRNVLETLCNYGWRGNIRELQSVMTRAVLLARAEQRTMIAMKDLPPEIAAAGSAVSLEDQIMESLREKKFSRSAISETAEELGGLNRGTVAEYFRGLCLKAFVEHTYDLDTAVRYISLSVDSSVNDRVRKKLTEYLSNIADAVDRSERWEAVRTSLRPKTKNLPQKYHPYLEQAAEAYYRRVWHAESNTPRTA